MRLIFRCVRLLGLVGVGLLLALLLDMHVIPRRRRESVQSWWNHCLHAPLGLRVTVHGTPLRGAHLAVANHVSWIDIPLIAAHVRGRFVSKSDVRDWPIAGLLASAVGTFYLERGRGGTRPLAEQLRRHLADGGTVVLFPEGTTSNGVAVLPFYARMLQPAVDAGVPVQPIALRYGHGVKGDDIAPFVGDDELLPHLLRVLRNGHLDAELLFLPPIDTRGRDRDEVADLARGAVCAALGAPPAARLRRTLADPAAPVRLN